MAKNTNDILSTNIITSIVRSKIKNIDIYKVKWINGTVGKNIYEQLIDIYEESEDYDYVPEEQLLKKYLKYKKKYLLAKECK